MSAQGFNKPNGFRDHLDEQLKNDEKKVNGYQPRRACNGGSLPPPKKP